MRSHSISSADLCAPASQAAVTAALPIASLDPSSRSLPGELRTPGLSAAPRDMFNDSTAATRAATTGPRADEQQQALTSAFHTIAAAWPGSMPFTTASKPSLSIKLPHGVLGPLLTREGTAGLASLGGSPEADSVGTQGCLPVNDLRPSRSA